MICSPLSGTGHKNYFSEHGLDLPQVREVQSDPLEDLVDDIEECG